MKSSPSSTLVIVTEIFSRLSSRDLSIGISTQSLSLLEVALRAGSRGSEVLSTISFPPSNRIRNFSVRPFGASLLFMNLGLETGDKATDDSHTRYLQTMGTYLTYKNSNWNLDGAFYYQMGKNKAAEKVSALMGSIQAAYTFNQTWGAVASFDYLSGDKGNGGKYKAFDPLYGTHHKFYGAMDYFYASTFANGYAPGLMDARIGGRFRLSGKVDMELNYHYFSTAVKVQDLKKYLGSEVDYQINWSIMKDVKLSAGYSFMRGTKTMDAVKTGNHKSWQDWGWLSLNINPKILFVKW